MRYYNDTVSKFNAVHALVGGAISGEGDNFTYHDGQTPPTKEQIDAKQKEMQAEYDAQAYARNRELEYPPIAELTVALYETDDRAAIDEKRAAVKTKWPKNNTGPVE
jgi:hypothetical protein